MNCANCGAPIKPVEGREHFRCSYCATIVYPEMGEGEVTLDGIEPLGVESEFDCPVCMTSLETARLEKNHVEYCKTCHGVLIDSDTFQITTWSLRTRYRDAPKKPVPLDTTQYHRRIPCPKCHELMDVHPYHGPGNVVIDSCSHCHYIWLDYGEINAIVTAPGLRGRKVTNVAPVSTDQKSTSGEDSKYETNDPIGPVSPGVDTFYTLLEILVGERFTI